MVVTLFLSAWAIIAAVLLIWQMAIIGKIVRNLNALRRNCFITNEKGHRVRYFNASPEKRAAAEEG